MADDNQHTISGLLRKRQELLDETGALKERLAIVANDVDAIDRVLDAFDYRGDMAGRTARAARQGILWGMVQDGLPSRWRQQVGARAAEGGGDAGGQQWRV